MTEMAMEELKKVIASLDILTIRWPDTPVNIFPIRVVYPYFKQDSDVVSDEPLIVEEKNRGEALRE